jgi:hypothetical protein
MLRNTTHPLVIAFVLSFCTFAAGQAQPAPTDHAVSAPVQFNPIPDLEKRSKMSDATRLEIIQVLNAELVHVRKTFPLGFKDITLTPDGKIKPEDSRLYQLAQSYGAAAKVGDRVQITNIVFREKSVYLEINGGPKKKSKWYQHVTIMGAGGGISPGSQDPNQAQPTGAAFSLEFKKYVPEMTGPELKQLLQPVLDFSVKSAAEVYVDTLPPKVREAVKKHEVLVGMNRDMVVMAKDRPPQKIREKDEKGHEYEEWIYGHPPQDVTFVRFIGDEVSQVKIMKVGGETTLRTEKEVDVKDGVVSLAAIHGQGADPSAQAAQREQQVQMEQPAHAPTLKRAGEQDDPEAARAKTGVSSTDHKSVPQWGTDGQEQPPQPKDPKDQSQQQPPPQ